MIIASIDIGSNTVLLLIAEADLQTLEIHTIRDEQRIPRISEGLVPGGIISQRSEERLFSVLKEYFALIKEYKCETVLLSGTNVFRIALNADKIVARIKNEYNADLKVLTGKQEAELAFWGTKDYENKNETRLVIDIGGGSTELIYGTDKILFSHSYNIGVVSVSEKYLNKNEPALSKLSLIDRYLEIGFDMLPDMLRAPHKTIALAGTPVTIACIQKGLVSYKEKEIEGSVLNYSDINGICNHLAELSPADILNLYPGIVKQREDLILSGSYILLYIMKLFNIDKVIVSTKGIRYGYIVKYLIEGNYK